MRGLDRMMNKNVMCSSLKRLAKTSLPSTTTTSTSALAAAPISSQSMVTMARPTMPLLEKVVVKVPTMGDSITEGTIVEWTAAVGQQVKEDDVIALIETDKVTIDIKAEINGVITQHYGQVDDNVNVGSELYEIDTQGTPTLSTATTTTNENDTTASQTSNTPTESTTTKSPTTRVPSIQFLGKEGWKKRKEAVATIKTIPQSTTTSSTSISDGSVIGPMYGRLPFSDREMEALLMGGASEEPMYTNK